MRGLKTLLIWNDLNRKQHIQGTVTKLGSGLDGIVRMNIRGSGVRRAQSI